MTIEQIEFEIVNLENRIRSLRDMKSKMNSEFQPHNFENKPNITSQELSISKDSIGKISQEFQKRKSELEFNPKNNQWLK